MAVLVLQVATGVASGVVNGLLHKGQTPPATTTPTPAPYDAVRDDNQALLTSNCSLILLSLSGASCAQDKQSTLLYQ